MGRGRRGLRGPGFLTAAVLAVLAVCAGCAPSPSVADPSGGLRIMTWNVLTARFDPQQWVGTIAAWRPAVVGLQEICADEAAALAELLRTEHGLPYIAVPGPIRPTPAEDADPVNAELRRPCHDGAVVRYGLAVLTLLPVTTATTDLFAPDHRDEQRGYQRVIVREPGGGSLTLYNTHVGLAGVQAAQIRDLASRAVREPGPTVVLGDLNVSPERDPAVLAPLRADFGDIDPEGRLRTSANDPDDPDVAPLDEIDHVFFRGLVSVEPATAPWTPASDHRPAIGTLGPPPGGRRAASRCRESVLARCYGPASVGRGRMRAVGRRTRRTERR
jgi:endonuclease/exonuclease/phosphatase family metal-dependent hydrolase